MYDLLYEMVWPRLWQFNWWGPLTEICPEYWPANDPSFHAGE